jgi:hypothetical protein
LVLSGEETDLQAAFPGTCKRTVLRRFKQAKGMYNGTASTRSLGISRRSNGETVRAGAHLTWSNALLLVPTTGSGIAFPANPAATGKYKGWGLAVVLKAAAAFNDRKKSNHLMGGRHDDFEGRKN